jgi:hypothetical protein
MGLSVKTRRKDDQIAQLAGQVEALKARLEALEGSPGGNGNRNGTIAPQSRRDLLKLAGAAAAGAAGSIVLGAIPAAAANGSSILLGTTTNDASTTTDILPTAATTPAPLFQATGQGVSPTTTVPATVSTTAPLSQSIPLIGAIGAGGALPAIGSPPVTDYPGFAPIQGVGGVATITVNGAPETESEGLNGWGGGANGKGVTGESDVGYGVVGGSGGIDIAALGNGRVLQLSLPTGLLANSPAGPPNYLPNDFEQVRDGNGVVWLSNADGTWRRLNSIITITPFRIYDSRPTPRPANSITTIPIAGVSGIPASAVGVVGSLTAIHPAADGFVTMYPTGQPVPFVNSLNYTKNISALSNHVTVALGTGGSVSVFVSANGSTNFLFDVYGYIQ